MKNLFKIALMALMLLSLETYAQESIIAEIKYADLEKYIDLAKQNFPRRKMFSERAAGIKTQLTVASLSYLDLFSASYFYRPQGKIAIDPINPYIVNGYQFGISLNLANFISKPFMVKKAKSDYKIALLEEKEYETQLVNEVKSKYYDYIQSISLLKISSQMASDNKGVAESLRSRFEKGEITLDAYNQSRINQFSAYQAKIAAEATYLKSKDILEEIIGTKLTDVK